MINDKEGIGSFLYQHLLSAKASLQSSVNYSKKAIKNHHGEVPVVVQKKKKKFLYLQYKQENKKKNNNNNKKLN